MSELGRHGGCQKSIGWLVNVSQVWIVVNAFTMFRKIQNIAGNGWLSRDHPTSHQVVFWHLLRSALRSRAVAKQAYSRALFL